VTETYPFAPLVDWCRYRTESTPAWGASPRPKLDAGIVAEILGLSSKGDDTGYRQLLRWGERGWLTEVDADRTAVALGVMPYIIWPQWLETGLAMANEYEDRLRRMDLEHVLRYQQRQPDVVRERNAARLRRLRAENPERYATAERAYYVAHREELVIKQRLRRQGSNREQINARRRERYAAKKEAAA
jgi:hypothetical protein